MNFNKIKKRGGNTHPNLIKHSPRQKIHWNTFDMVNAANIEVVYDKKVNRALRLSGIDHTRHAIHRVIYTHYRYIKQ